MATTKGKSRRPKGPLKSRSASGMSESAQAILTMIQQVPVGRVASYGQIARLAGYPRNSRQVGSILRKLPRGSETPWFRIVNSKGEISGRSNPDAESYQREKLQSEGIEFDSEGRVSLKKFGWEL